HVAELRQEHDREEYRDASYCKVLPARFDHVGPYARGAA
ncbi:MAG: hypothetical protein PWR16_1053, partial [Methanoculleus sp.]|nr:hypothetical protein [Methanoculleus sp.]